MRTFLNEGVNVDACNSVGGIVAVGGVGGGVVVFVVVVVVVYLKRLRIVLRCAKAGCGRRTSSS